MVRLSGVCFGLLAFSAMIVCGMIAGNPVMVIMHRALIGLIVGFVFGSLIAAVGLSIVRDNAGDEDLPEALEEATEIEVP